jgi:hypothetical protein
MTQRESAAPPSGRAASAVRCGLLCGTFQLCASGMNYGLSLKMASENPVLTQATALYYLEYYKGCA